MTKYPNKDLDLSFISQPPGVTTLDGTYTADSTLGLGANVFLVDFDIRPQHQASICTIWLMRS